MSNLRIVYDNAASRVSSLVASSTAGSLVAANLLTDIKSQTWRATGTSATLTATWSAAETLGVVVLPFCNFTSSATIRVRGYTNPGDPSPIFDTGTVSACPSVPAGLKGWGTIPLGVNAFAYGGGAYACAWFSPMAVKQVVIDLSDASNPAGYVEASRLVTGNYWSPTYNADYGATISAQDTSKPYRNDAGDLLTDLGPRHRSLSFTLSHMVTTDRLSLMNIFLGNGLSMPVFLSLYPQCGDAALEQTYQIYAKFAQSGAMAAQVGNTYSAQVQLDEV